MHTDDRGTQEKAVSLPPEDLGRKKFFLSILSARVPKFIHKNGRLTNAAFETLLKARNWKPRDPSHSRFMKILGDVA